MHIQIKTSSGKAIAELTLIEFLRTIAIIIFIIWCVVSKGEPIFSLYEYLLQTIQPEKETNTSPIFQVIAIILLLISTIAIIFYIRNIFKGLMVALIHRSQNKSKNKKKNIGALVLKKAIDELRSIKLSSSGDFDSGCENAINDEKILVKASENNILNNRNPSESDWSNYLNNNEKFQKIRDIPADIDDFNASRETLRAELKELSKNSSQGILINFLVASVQPSIILAARKVINECGLASVISFMSNVSTGPETVKEATTICKEDLKKTDIVSPVTVFAAPLSAFVLSEYSENETNNYYPHEFFYPICNLIDERQEILVVENGKTTPLRKGKVHYYDNSTAEEHMAHIYDNVHQHMSFHPIEDYEIYKEVLYGKDKGLIDVIKPGDGIIVWPPLTEHFTGRNVSNGHFVSQGIERVTHTNSKIVLYCQKAIFDSPNTDSSKLCHLFMRMLLFELQHLKYQLDEPFAWAYKYSWNRKYLSKYKHQFNDIV